MNTLKEVIEALKPIDKKAALYLWDNFDEDDFQNGCRYCDGALRNGSAGPLDFFDWSIDYVFNWRQLNDSLKDMENNETSLKDYTTKDIDFSGCDPIIADALKQNKSILCKTNGGIEKVIVLYKDSSWPYVDQFGDQYNYAEPIKKPVTEIRVKDPVSVMQWLIDNRYTIGVSGLYPEHPHDQVFLFEFFECCNLHPPENWQWPELLENVAVYESDKTTDFIDSDYFAASESLRIARNWIIEAAKNLEELHNKEATKHAKELRGAAEMISDWCVALEKDK